MKDIETILKGMTLEQKADFVCGADTWHTVSNEALDVPPITMSDGPHGLRTKYNKHEMDELAGAAIPAVCFPPACATACSFNEELIYQMGQALGNECQYVGIDVLLGPGVNIKRSPIGGRNFEYFSEDPTLAGKMGTAFVKGVQSEGVGTSLKHYALNSQEFHRLSCSSEVDERTMHELYLAPFEKIVKEAQPWTVMCSYNRVNGVYASESKELLDDILRDKWGFEGVVVSDWGAVSDRVEGVKNGLDIEMPYQGEISRDRLLRAVKEGRLTEADLDKRVRLILKFVQKCVAGRKDAEWDMEKDHALAKKVCDECIVLLKNEDNVLPLAKTEKIAVIGEFAKEPRYQGGGSSHVNAFKVTGAFDYMENATYAKGYHFDARMDQELIDEAVAVAKAADKAVIFAGLPENYESEGYDRDNMQMPESHNALISAVAAVNPNVVVVLHNGSPVEMPWIDQVKGVVEVYLGGQAVGHSTADILYGVVNPSGKLAETFPIRFEDNPAYIDFLGKKEKTYYREGVFIGYRYYDKKKMDVLFPFGYGLSYTTFAYSDLKLDKTKLKDTDTLTATVTVTNTGKVAGKETVQLYVSDQTGRQLRPIRELRAFAKVELAPGESKKVSFTLGKRDFAYYSEGIHDFYAEDGKYLIEIGADSRDIRLSAEAELTVADPIPVKIDENVCLGELIDDPYTHKYGVELQDLYIYQHYTINNRKPRAKKSFVARPIRLLRRDLQWTEEEMMAFIKKVNDGE